MVKNSQILDYFGGTKKISEHLCKIVAGLFNRVIIQSGSTFSQVSFFSKDVAKEVTRELAKLVGCNTSLSQGIFDCFMELDPEIFFFQQAKLAVSK